MTNKQEYVVYEVRLNNIPIYIGSGIKGREQHATSGCSHNPKLNEIFFKEKENMEVFILREGLEKQESLEIEKEYIQATEPLCNQVHVAKRVLNKRKK